MAAWIAPLIGGIGSYLGAKKQADAVDAQNALSREQLEYQKQLQAPTFAGATQAIENYGQFAPFVTQQRQAGATGLQQGRVAQGGVQNFLDAGAQGLEAQRNLAKQSGAPGTLGIAGQYFNPFFTQQVQQAQYAVNEQADRQRRESAINQAARGGALSSQAARAQGQIEAQRAAGIHKAQTDFGAQQWQNALNEARRQQQYQQGLAGTLAGHVGTGLNTATTGLNLASTGAQQGYQAPFAPFNAYQQTVSGLGLPHTQVEAAPSALGAGLGSALNIYDALNRPQTGG